MKFEQFNMGQFLSDTLNSRSQKATILQAATKAIEEVGRAPDNVDAIVLSMHLSYLSRGIILQPSAWHVVDDETKEVEPIIFKYIVGKFAPHYVISMVDDVQAAHKVVKDSNITLKDLMRWRNVETYLADTIANVAHFYSENAKSLHPSHEGLSIPELYPYEFSPVIPIRNDLRTLTRYVFERKIPRVYSSFPISRPRRVANPKVAMDEINRHNEWLCNKFTVFNPLAIDERPMVATLSHFLKGREDAALSLDERLTIPAEAQWQLNWNETLLGEPRQAVELYVKDVFDISARLYDQTSGGSPTPSLDDDPATLRKQMLRLIEDGDSPSTGQNVAGKSDIDRQITERDLRMIDQSDCVVIYRPTMDSQSGKHQRNWTSGTQEEYRYARSTKKEIIVVRDESHDRGLDEDGLGFEVPPNQILKGSDLHTPENQDKLHLELAAMIQDRVRDVVATRVLQTDHLLSAVISA